MIFGFCSQRINDILMSVVFFVFNFKYFLFLCFATDISMLVILVVLFKKKLYLHLFCSLAKEVSCQTEKGYNRRRWKEYTPKDDTKSIMELCNNFSKNYVDK